MNNGQGAVAPDGMIYGTHQTGSRTSKGTKRRTAEAPGFSEPKRLPGIGAVMGPGEFKEGVRNDSDRTDGSVVALDPEHLEFMRIIAHNVLDLRSRAYYMLRGKFCGPWPRKNQPIGVTSPTAGCGKTLTSVNLAMSIARQQDKSALLVDLESAMAASRQDPRPEASTGVFGALEGKMTLPDAILRAQIGNHQVSLLPCETSTSHSSEWCASHETRSLIQDIRTYCRSQIAIIDLPPVLTGDDVISILPHLDCVILVTAVGVSTTSDIERCKRHLQSTEVVRVVLNKSAEQGVEHYYY